MLSVVKTGNGVPIIFLHGWGLHRGVWDGVLPTLEKDFTCYAVDMLGHGESQLKSNKHFSLENMREVLNDLIASIDSEEIILLGWSLGGLVAMDYLSHCSSKVKKLVLVSSNVCFCKKENWTTGLALNVLESFSEQLEQDYKRTIDKFMALQIMGAEDSKKTLRILKGYIENHLVPSIGTLRDGLSALKNIDLRDKLGSIKQPVLMVAGEKDRLIPPQAAVAMQELFNEAECKIIKGAGHAPFISHHESFIEIINTYIKE